MRPPPWVLTVTPFSTWWSFFSELPPAKPHRMMREIEDATGAGVMVKVLGPDARSGCPHLWRHIVGDDGGRLPRDEILRYAFVLAPLTDVAASERHPVSGDSYGICGGGLLAPTRHICIASTIRPGCRAGRAIESARRCTRSFVSGAVARRVAVFLAFLSGYFLLGMAGLQPAVGADRCHPLSGRYPVLRSRWSTGSGCTGGCHRAGDVGARLVGWRPPRLLRYHAGSMLSGAARAADASFQCGSWLRHLRDALLFVAIGPVLGPMLSATAGGIAFAVAGGEVIDPLRLWLLWWLGNSVGIPLVGGFDWSWWRVAPARRA